jgi:magnesium transporter
MLEEKIAASAAPVALRDEDGALRGGLVDRMAQAIVAGDAAVLRTLLGDLHESDVGDLIQALDAELRPRLVSLMGPTLIFRRSPRSIALSVWAFWRNCRPRQ